MKKTILAVFALLAVFACGKKEMDIQTPEQEVDNTPMSFNLSVNPMNGDAETKAALKAGWSNGDVVYVFFDAISTKYIKKSYDGSTWTNTFPGGAFVASDFSASGPAANRNMTAVWFPKEMGAVTVTYADSKFSFTIGGEKIYSHYMSVHAGYTVDETTISGTLNMEKPAGFVQFFVPGIAADDAPTYRLMESHLTPKACDYVALAGGVAESARTAGYSIKGMAFTSDASVDGALFGGYLSSAGVATAYAFSLVKEISVEKPAAVGTYTLSGTKTINEGTSMTFPVTSSVWEYSQFVDLGFGDILWATGNIDKTHSKIVDPLEAGEYFMYGKTTLYSSSEENYTGGENPLSTSADVAYSVNTSWRIPTIAQFDALINSSNTTTDWETGWTNIGSTKGGRLIISNVNGISLFFAAAGYYSNGSLYAAGDYGRYWSSSPRYDPKFYFAYALRFDNGKIETYHLDRTLGYSVRPVKAAAAPAPSVPTGAIDGLFSVSDTKQVYFAKGNLQYSKSTGIWSFMENQYSTVETLNQNVGIDYASQDIVSLFGWGTSGWNNGNTYYQPYNTTYVNKSEEGYGYGPTDGSTYTYNLTGTYANADWGHNAISNGGNTADFWRTLTKGEWEWLLGPQTSPNPGTNCRTSSTVNGTANARFAKAYLFGTTHGIIIFPDSYTHPDGVAAPTGINATNSTSWSGNQYNATDWAKMEAAGCVFLPAAGRRNGATIYYANSEGYYWSSTYKSTGSAYYVSFNDFKINTADYNDRNTGYSVRLVHDAN